MGEWAERAIEEEMCGPRCLDCDETPCMCDDGDLDDDDDTCPHGVPFDEDCNECEDEEDDEDEE